METSFKRLKYKADSDDILSDCMHEVSDLLEIELPKAQEIVDEILGYYYFRNRKLPDHVPDEIFRLIVHVTQPFRIPGMTERMDTLLAKLEELSSPRNILDYGGGGGKDSIIFARAGYKVTYADFPDLMTPYVSKRFHLRNLNIEIKDIRRLENDRRFDVINCMDVVEHVYDVEYIVADLLSRLNEGGYLLCRPTFANDWGGDHIEKNCGYRPYFTRLLSVAGFTAVIPPREEWFAIASRLGIMPTRLQLYHLRRTRKIDGPITEERDRIRTELYKFSRRLSLMTMMWCAAALPFILFIHIFIICTRSSQLRNASRRILDTNLDNIFDNYSINRLARHRLKTKSEWLENSLTSAS